MPCGCTGVCNVLQRSEEGLAGHSATPASPCPPATTLSLPPPTQNLFAAARVHMALRTRQRDPENDTMRKGGAPATANSSRKRCCLVIQEPPPQKWGPLMLLLQLLTIQRLPVEVTVLLILPNSTIDLLGNLHEEHVTSIPGNHRAKAPAKSHSSSPRTSSGIPGAIRVPLGSSVTTPEGSQPRETPLLSRHQEVRCDRRRLGTLLRPGPAKL